MKTPGSLALDSSVIVQHLRAGSPGLSSQLKAAAELYLPLTVLGEMLYGIRKSGNDPRAVRQWSEFSKNVVLLPNDEATAHAYAELKAHLAAKGKLIPENDIWIAASAKSHDLPLLCSDAHYDVLRDVMSVIQV